ncbi:hypothetical protein VPH35_002437 [Triticum aestivum]
MGGSRLPAPRSDTATSFRRAASSPSGTASNSKQPPPHTVERVPPNRSSLLAVDRVLPRGPPPAPSWPHLASWPSDCGAGLLDRTPWAASTHKHQGPIARALLQH